MDKKRRTVRCWFCGKKVRRVPNSCGIKPDMLDDKGRVKIVLRKRTVVPYGVCGTTGHPWHPDGCPNPLLLPRDAAFVLRAALQYERGGYGFRSEFDI
jgi:hypothetical protein